MRKTFLFVLLLFISFILVACGQSLNEESVTTESTQTEETDSRETEETTGKSDQAKDNESESQEKAEATEKTEKEEVKLMSDDEIQSIVVDNLDTIDAKMLELHEKHFYSDDHWEIHETIFEPANDDKTVKKAVAVTKSQLKDLVTKDELEDMARMKLYDYFRHLEGASLSSYNIATRFEVLDQTPNSFEVSFLDLETDAGYTPAGTFIVQYKKNHDKWKFDGFEFITPDKKPFNLTFEDIQKAYNDGDSKVEFVDEVETPNGTYIIVKQHDYQFGIHVDDSTIDYEIAE